MTLPPPTASPSPDAEPATEDAARAAVPDWARGEEVPLTDYRPAEIAAGRYRAQYRIAAGAPLPRGGFLVSDPVDTTVSPYGHLFHDPGFARFPDEAIWNVELGPAEVCGVDGVVAVDGRVVRETVDHLPYWLPDCCVAAATQRARIVFKPTLRGVPGTVPGPHFVGAAAGWMNYSHWLCECLPRLVAFLLARTTRPDLKVILPRFAPGSFQQTTLDLLGIPEAAIHRVRPHEAVRFEAVSLAIGIDIWSVSPFAAQAAWLLRTAHAAAHPMAEIAPGIPPEAAPRRLYIHRPPGTTRRVANFEACRPVIEAAGFSIEVFDDKPMAAQIGLMRAAACVVAEHGAGVANLMFCEPGTPAIEIFSPACVQPAHWSLAARCGHPFGFLVGTHADENPPGWGTHYAIDPERLRTVLGAL